MKRNVVDLFQRMVSLVQYLPDQLSTAVMNVEDPRQVVYLIASSVQMSLELRQQLLETRLSAQEAGDDYLIPRART